MKRVLTLCGTLLILWSVVALANHLLAGANVHLFAGALFVAFAARALPYPEGFAAALFGGWVCDANSFVPFGTHALLFAAAFTALFALRDRLPREATVHHVSVALAANLALFAAVSVPGVGRPLAPAPAWQRLASDLLSSEAFLVLAAPWFFALQARACPSDPDAA